MSVFGFCVCAAVLLCLLGCADGDCSMQNYCNGHGTCINSTSVCSCYEGWGAATDITFYSAPDCSSRTCPSGRAWADIPSSSTTAHAYAECSNRGVCDRSSGLCACFDGFTGAACQRNKCPNDCSGHGLCLSIKQLARSDSALPLGPNTFYEGDEVQLYSARGKQYFLDNNQSMYHASSRMQLHGMKIRSTAVYVIHRGRSVSAPGKRRSRSGSDRTVPKVTESHAYSTLSSNTVVTVEYIT